MANLERGFRRVTFAFSVVACQRLLVDGVLSFFETAGSTTTFLVPTAVGFALPWLVFFVARWIARGSVIELHGARTHHERRGGSRTIQGDKHKTVGVVPKEEAILPSGVQVRIA